jgi:DNA-binding GntR family transcriptional regulator
MSDRKGGGDLIADDVRAKLRSMILGSEFRPGQRLVEDDLCATLGVGRTPVREALLLLQGEGYLARERGWVVRDVDRSKVNAIFESRAAIEGAAARLAASRISRANCDKLDAMIDIMEPSKKLARPELNQINTRFHNAIVEAADNPLLVEFHKRTQFFYWMLRVPVLFGDDEVRTTNNQHRRIVRALKRRDGDEAERASREHVEATMAIVVPALRF